MQTHDLQRTDSLRRQIRKFESHNPLQNYILAKYIAQVGDWIDAIDPRSILDAGCGEGFIWQRLAARTGTRSVLGIDAREDAVELANTVAGSHEYMVSRVEDFDCESRFDLVIATEVLEHVNDPANFLSHLCRLTSRWLILTVPLEPFFQMLNLMRGRDILKLGNHPEHVQHWSRRGFLKFVSPWIRVRDCKVIFPFTMVLGEHPKL